MRAAVFHGPRDIRLSEVPDPTPKTGEVLVRVQRAGICGSDVKRFLYGSYPWPPGFIMGHEFCGEIAKLGPEAGGDRKSTRLNSSHGYISYAPFCFKKQA